MKRIAFLFFIACTFAHAATGPGNAVLVYYPNFEPNEKEGISSALRDRSANFNQVATDTFSVNASGKVSGPIFAHELEFARSRNMVTYATVSNFAGDDFNSALGHAVITSPAATRRFIAGTTKILIEGHFNGINVDFESIPMGDRAAFTAFITQVAQAMKAGGFLTVVSAPAEQSDDPGNDWSGAFDFKALGGIVDVLQMMTYDENGSWGKPGPVAGFDWVEKSVQYAVTVVPPEKISLGFPAYGYDWDLKDKTKNTSVPWNKMTALIADNQAKTEWDAASSSPHFTYTKDGHRHVVWYENARSLGLKAGLVATYHLGGISVWALGMEDAAFWQALATPSP